MAGEPEYLEETGSGENTQTPVGNRTQDLFAEETALMPNIMNPELLFLDSKVLVYRNVAASVYYHYSLQIYKFSCIFVCKCVYQKLFATNWCSSAT